MILLKMKWQIYTVSEIKTANITFKIINSKPILFSHNLQLNEAVNVYYYFFLVNLYK